MKNGRPCADIFPFHRLFVHLTKCLKMAYMFLVNFTSYSYMTLRTLSASISQNDHQSNHYDPKSQPRNIKTQTLRSI